MLESDYLALDQWRSKGTPAYRSDSLGNLQALLQGSLQVCLQACQLLLDQPLADLHR